ncbi:hypothetical protein ACQPZF_00970 [Actinosynnema sp. CS-041913]|uniref:hypothetical protein n=1 Tax=Actinosynnema sp. CS-041913 TaxID=3239917 RepID=UPI003D8FA1E1
MAWSQKKQAEVAAKLTAGTSDWITGFANRRPDDEELQRLACRAADAALEARRLADEER